MDRFRFGRSVRALRQRRDWRLVDLAERSGLSRSVVDRIELGQSDRIALGDLEAVARALDGQLGLDFRWRGEQLDRLIDEHHASIVDHVVGLYHAARWDVAVEASFSIYGERGSIDVFAWHRGAQVVAVNEIKASIGEAGNTVIGRRSQGAAGPARRDRARLDLPWGREVPRSRRGIDVAGSHHAPRGDVPDGVSSQHARVPRLDSRPGRTTTERHHLRDGRARAETAVIGRSFAAARRPAPSAPQDAADPRARSFDAPRSFPAAHAASAHPDFP